VHPLYFPVLYPLLDAPIAELRVIEGKDPRLWRGAPPRMSRGLRDAIIEALRGEIIAGRDLLEI
jgi:hypothetical protein